MGKMTTRKMAASILGVDTQTIDEWRHGGKLPSVKVGHFVRIPLDAVKMLAEERRALQVSA